MLNNTIIGWVAFALIFMGCSDISPKPGQLECESRADCPPHWICRADALCYPEDPDAGDGGCDASDACTDS